MRIHSHQIIFKDSKCYSTFPSIERVSDQELIVVFRQAGDFSAKAAQQDKVTHHHTESWISSIRSFDNGSSWDLNSVNELYRSKYGVNDPAISRLSNGDLVLRVCEIDVRPTRDRANLAGDLISHRVEHGLVSALVGNVVLNLSNSKPIKVECGEYTQSCSRESITELPDGSWLLPVYLGAPFRTDRAILLRSYNSGKTWGDASVIFEDLQGGPSDLQGINFNETSILSLGGGEMLAAGRADETFHTEGKYIPVGGVGNLFFSRSHNWGLSWSRPMKTPIFGQPPHLMKFGEKLVCTYGHRKTPFGIRAIISRDAGVSWDFSNEVVLRDDGISWDLGYPVTIGLDNERLLTVYYFLDEKKVRHIAGTIWSID